jgi:hypothetical protein
MERDDFAELLSRVTSKIAGRTLDGSLATVLEAEVPPDGPLFGEIRDACHAAVEAGWMCKHEAGGIRFGRVLRPGPGLAGFSVDVVHMDDVVGPHHVHPQGEVDMVMPIDAAATFDGHGAGWVVYEPGSAHRPTVRGGAALVLYLLPEGAIEFTEG